MNLQRVLFNHFQADREQTAQQYKVAQLEEKIMTQIGFTQPTASTFTFSFLRAGLGFLTVLLIVLGLGWYQATQENSPSFIPSLTSPAKAAVLSIQQSLQTSFSYTIERRQSCDGIDFEALSRNEDGTHAYDPISEKLKQDCSTNSNRLTSVAHYYVDPNQKAVRKETPVEEWQISPSLPDKQGQLHESIIQPLVIQKDGTTYTFVAAATKKSNGLYDGVFVKPSTTDPAFAQNRHPRLEEELITPQGVLETYSKAPDNEIQVEERSENNTTYTVLTHRSKGLTTHREDWFLKENNLPYKSIDFNLDKEGIRYETYYKDFDTTTNATAFDLNTPPQGYEFIRGQISSVFVNALACTTCVYDDALTYQVMINKYTNTDGKQISFPAQELERVVNLPLDFSVAEKTSDGSFAKLNELIDTTSILSFKLGKVYRSNFTIGSTAETTLQIVSTDKKTGTTTQFNQNITIPYTATQLPGTEKIQFKYVTNYGRMDAASYLATQAPETIISVMKMTDDDLCKGFREPTTCEVKSDGEYLISTVKQIKPGTDQLEWMRTDIQYKGLFVTIQYSQNNPPNEEIKQNITDNVKQLLPIIEAAW